MIVIARLGRFTLVTWQQSLVCYDNNASCTIGLFGPIMEGPLQVNWHSVTDQFRDDNKIYNGKQCGVNCLAHGPQQQRKRLASYLGYSGGSRFWGYGGGGGHFFRN